MGLYYILAHGLLYNWHCVENKTDYALCPKNVKLISRNFFFYVFASAITCHFKVYTCHETPKPVKSKELKGAKSFLRRWQSFSKFRILFILWNLKVHYHVQCFTAVPCPYPVKSVLRDHATSILILSHLHFLLSCGIFFFFLWK